MTRAHVWSRKVALVILGASVALSACGRQSTKPGKPICQVTPDTLNCGHVELGRTASLVFRNRSHAHNLAAVRDAGGVASPPRCASASRRRHALPATRSARHPVHMTSVTERCGRADSASVQFPQSDSQCG